MKRSKTRHLGKRAVESQRYNFGLVFDTETAAGFASLSQAIVRDCHATFSLGEKAEPHITILQFSAAEGSGKSTLR